MTATERDSEWLKAAAEDHQDQVEKHMAEEWAERWANTNTSPLYDALERPSHGSAKITHKLL